MTAYIGLGSNIGDRLAHLRAAVALLDASDGVDVVGASSVYDTEPVGPAQPNFLNAAVAVETTLAARALLDRCKQIETEVGRHSGERWGPREIDLDLLVFGEATIDEPGLTVPHRSIAQRGFVLVPLLDLDPVLEIPGLGQVSALLDDIGTAGISLTAHALR